MGILLFSAEPASAYYVNGVVDFTYTNSQTKVGGVRTSSYTFTEHYEATLGGFLFDPRFLRFTAGAGYNRNHTDNSPDSDAVTYNVRASFFPGRMIAWDVYGMKSVMTVQGGSSIAGYDVDSTSYGASLDLRLSRLRSRYGNNANNNSNNGNDNIRRGGFVVPLPDVFLSTSHTESESKNPLNALHETRDDQHATIMFRPSSRMDLTFDITDQTYKNLNNGSGYESVTANLASNIHVASNGDLKITGRLTDRDFNNIPGFASAKDRTWNYTMQLDFKERNGLSHAYRYDYARQEAAGTKYTTQGGSALVRYYVLPELNLNSGVNYSQSDYVRQPTAADPVGQESTMQSGGLFAGASYGKVYAPAFLDPFAFHGNYDFSSGFSKITSATAGQQEGSGWYYQNSVNLGLNSTGWKQESMTADYSYSSRRDHSPLGNNAWSQTYRLGMSTSRVPRTTISASGSYSVQESTAGSSPGIFSGITPNSIQGHRTTQYTASIDHAATSYLSLTAGASQGNTKSNTNYTLSTIESNYETKERQLYAGATLNYPISRNLSYRASIREENRHIQPGTGDTVTYLATTGLDYRIRKVFITLDYRWREDVPENSLRVQQSYFFAKLSRPF